MEQEHKHVQVHMQLQLVLVGILLLQLEDYVLHAQLEQPHVMYQLQHSVKLDIIYTLVNVHNVLIHMQILVLLQDKLILSDVRQTII